MNVLGGSFVGLDTCGCHISLTRSEPFDLFWDFELSEIGYHCERGFFLTLTLNQEEWCNEPCSNSDCPFDDEDPSPPLREHTIANANQ